MGVFKPQNAEKNKEFYQRLAEGRCNDYIWGKDKRFDPVRLASSPSIDKFFTSKVAPYISKRHQVLDLGCGSGVFLPILAPMCQRLFGIDISYHMLETSVKVIDRFSLDNVTLLNASAEAMPFPENEFDIVVLVDAIHHIPQLTKTLTELKRVLKPGGQALVFEPNKLNPLLSLLCLLDRNEWGALRLGSKKRYLEVFKAHFTIDVLEYNGLLIGPDTAINRKIVDLLASAKLRNILGWQCPKIFIVMTVK
ncbi:MAG: class I SAM-dependent methyltransferase [Planctomycetota bacterium]